MKKSLHTLIKKASHTLTNQALRTLIQCTVMCVESAHTLINKVLFCEYKSNTKRVEFYLRYRALLALKYTYRGRESALSKSHILRAEIYSPCRTLLAPCMGTSDVGLLCACVYTYIHGYTYVHLQIDIRISICKSMYLYVYIYILFWHQAWVRRM